MAGSLITSVFGDSSSAISSAASQLTLGLGGNGIGSKVSSVASDLAADSSSLFSDQYSFNSAANPERLFLARARYADKSHQGPDGRGQFAYIKLLTNPALKTAYTTGDITKREVFDSNAKELFSWASNMVSGDGYSKFLLTGVSGQFNEKVQVREVFGDGEVAYFFGRQPVYLSLSGILIDSPDNQWFTDWVRMYSEFFRGTQLAKNYELLKLVLPNMTAIGTVVGMAWNQDSSSDVDVGFTLQFLVQSIAPNPVVSANMVNTNGVKLISFPKAAGFLDKAGINVLKNQVTKAQLTGAFKNPASTLADKAGLIAQLGQGVQSFQKSVDSVTSSVKGEVSDILASPLVSSVGSTLNGIRSTLFSPIYGVLSSLTKLLTTVTSGAKTIFDAFVQPVRNTLRDITNIARQASALEGQVTRSIDGLGRYFGSQLSGVQTDYKAAITAIGRATGSVASVPGTALVGVSALHSGGAISGSTAFLKSNPRSPFSRAVLKSGTSTPTKPAILKATYANGASNKASTLKG